MRVTRTSYRMLTLSAAALVGLAFAPTNGYATALIIPDSGILTIANVTGTVVGVTTTPSNCINWAGTGACNTTAVTMGVSGVSSIFAVGNGTIGDILGGVSETTPFETVTGAGVETGNTINFLLNTLVTNGGTTVGNCASNAAFNSCTPANSPFTFSEDSTGTQLTISFTALLSGYTGTSGSGTTPYRSIFATQQSGTLSGTGSCNGATANITTALTCEASGGTITATWSANESPITGTPEPVSALLIGSGLIGVALFGRRLRRS